MRKRVILTIKQGSGSFEQGFPVFLQIRNEGSTSNESVFTGKLPRNLKIPQVLNQWQSAYDQWVRTPRIIPHPGQVTNVSVERMIERINLSSQQLKKCLNTWLNSDFFEWRRLREQLMQHLSREDEIRFIIETEDNIIRQLPWHLWDFFQGYQQVEFAFSQQQFQISQPPEPTNKVRILAILGYDSGEIDVNLDIAILQQELNDEAEITFLRQPQRQRLNEQLWNQQWHIFYFAGHSASQADGSIGQIWINQNESLSIDDLRYGLNQAISQGLQLALFNSCDGLGLARELADLHIPHTIVMRKPVDDRVAHDFLRHFIKAFASGKSLYLAVREAREKLQGWESQFPCASWLPTIFENHTQEPLTWQALLLPRQVVRKPPDSKVELNINREKDLLKIVIPAARKLDCCKVLLLLSLAMVWGFCLVLAILVPLGMLGSPDSFLVGLIFLPVAVFMIRINLFPMTKAFLCDIFVDILKVTGHHNRRQFSVNYKLFKFTIFRGRCIPKNFLTQEEIQWLDYELKNWLNSWYSRHLPVCGSVLSLPYVNDEDELRQMR
ncbi:hypothetical protein B7486_40605 [cyanobacterium TDX16]|nr:hypothetical protein B7486_40605 [cyanobacterium TDX16]